MIISIHHTWQIISKMTLSQLPSTVFAEVQLIFVSDEWKSIPRPTIVVRNLAIVADLIKF